MVTNVDVIRRAMIKENLKTIGIESGLQYFRLNHDGSFQHQGLLKHVPARDEANASGQQLFSKLVELADETWIESFLEFADINVMENRQQALLIENHHLENPTTDDVLTIWFAAHSGIFADIQLPMDQCPDAAQMPTQAAQFALNATRLINDALGSSKAGNDENQQDLVDGSWGFYFRNSRYLIPLFVLLLISVGLIVAD